MMHQLRDKNRNEMKTDINHMKILKQYVIIGFILFTYAALTLLVLLTHG